MRQNQQPIVHLFRLEIEDRDVPIFYQLGQENFQESIVHEEGTLAMYLGQNKSNAQEYYVFEQYADEMAYAKHRESLPFLNYAKKAQTMLKARHSYPLKVELLLDKLPQQKNWHTNTLFKLAMIRLKNERVSDFREAVLKEMKASIEKEDGVFSLNAFSHPDDSQQWLFFEVYRDEATYQSHRETLHFQEYIEKTLSMLESKELLDLKGIGLVTKGQNGSST